MNTTAKPIKGFMIFDGDRPYRYSFGEIIIYPTELGDLRLGEAEQGAAAERSVRVTVHIEEQKP